MSEPKRDGVRRMIVPVGTERATTHTAAGPREVFLLLPARNDACSGCLAPDLPVLRLVRDAKLQGEQSWRL